MDRLEKIIWVVTGVIVVVVVILAKFGPIKSELSAQAAWEGTEEANRDNKFLEAAQKRNKGFAFNAPGAYVQPQAAAPSAQPPHPAAPGQKPPAQPPPGQVQPPPAPGQPAVAPIVFVPASAREKYQHFDDLVELGNTAVGNDVDYNGQTAFQITEIAEGSPLANQLGFQPRDIIISVNGYPANMGNSRHLFDVLQNEKQFSVEIDRGGQRLTIPYHIR